MFYALLGILHVETNAGEIVRSVVEQALVQVQIQARHAHDAVLCRQAMIKAGRAELARRGVESGTVSFLGGEPLPVAVDPAVELRIASWR